MAGIMGTRGGVCVGCVCMCGCNECVLVWGVGWGGGGERLWWCCGGVVVVVVVVWLCWACSLLALMWLWWR